jgi:hypothetical protein
MPDQGPAGPEQSGEPEAWVRHESARRFWILPAATFLVGLVLGGALIALTGFGSDDDPTATPAVTASPNPSASGSPSASALVVPGECVQIAEDSQALLALVNDAAQAALELDADQLSDLVAQMKTQQELVRSQAAACQSAVASASPLPSPSPS